MTFKPSPLLRRIQASATRAREEMSRMVPTPGCAFPMNRPLLPTDPLAIAVKQIGKFFDAVKDAERRGENRIDALDFARNTGPL